MCEKTYEFEVLPVIDTVMNLVELIRMDKMYYATVAGAYAQC